MLSFVIIAFTLVAYASESIALPTRNGVKNFLLTTWIPPALPDGGLVTTKETSNGDNYGHQNENGQDQNYGVYGVNGAFDQRNLEGQRQLPIPIETRPSLSVVGGAMGITGEKMEYGGIRGGGSLIAISKRTVTDLDMFPCSAFKNWKPAFGIGPVCQPDEVDDGSESEDDE